MESTTLAQVWHERVRRTPDALAFEYPERGVWRHITWLKADDRVRRMALGLKALGVGPGDRVAIFAGTRVEWILLDLAILCIGAVPVTIYPSSTAAECAWILQDSGAVVCVAEGRKERARVQTVAHRLPALRHLLHMDGAGPGSLDALERRGSGRTGFRTLADAVRPHDLATLIYTSGTTGRPKGVMLSHDGWIYEAQAIEEQVRALREPDDKQYLFLPLAHAFGKVLQLVAVYLGMPTAVNGDLDGLLDGLQQTRPTFMGAVPRVFEKVHARVLAAGEASAGARRQIFRRAVQAGERWTEAHLAGERIGYRDELAYRVARRLVYSRVQGALGGRVRAFVSGGAPLAPEIARFFYAAGIRILEGYGLTETSAGATGNRYDHFRFGTVGQAFPGSEVRIAPDGEVWIRGRHVMRGYWNRPEATAEVLDAQGWFKTGDLGRLDADGFLQITGRKKDILITAAGKNIAPQPIENRLKVMSPWVSEVVMLGDRRPYCVALISVDEEHLERWATARGLGAGSYAERVQLPEVQSEIEAEVARLNAELPSYSTIKRIALLPRPLSVEGGELTPSLKVRRAVVADRYRALVEALYAAPRASQP